MPDKDTSIALEQPVVAVAVRGPVLPCEAAALVARSSHLQPGTTVPTPPNWLPGSAVVVPVLAPVREPAPRKMVEEYMMQPLLVEEAAAGLTHMVSQVVMGLKTVLANLRCCCLYTH